MTTKYYDFPKSKKWLETGLASDSPYDIGGRVTDISEIGDSLEKRIKAIFPVNELPLPITTKLDSLKSCLKESEVKIQEFIMFVCNYTKI